MTATGRNLLGQVLCASQAEMPGTDTCKADRTWEETRSLETSVVFPTHHDCDLSYNMAHIH